MDILNAFAAAQAGVSPLPFVFLPKPNKTALAALRIVPNGKPIHIEIYETKNFDQIVESVLHEYRHSYQLQNGLLKTNGPNVENCIWNNKKNQEKNYYYFPWEVDARQWAREKVIEFNRFWRENAAQF